MPEGQFRGDKPAAARAALPAGDVARRVQGSQHRRGAGLGRGGEQTGAPRGTRLAGQGAVYAPGDPDSRWPCRGPSQPPGIGRRPGDKVYSRRDLACRTRTPRPGRGSVPRPSRGRSRHPLCPLRPQLRGPGSCAHASPRRGPGQGKAQLRAAPALARPPQNPLSPSQARVLPCPTVASPGMHRNRCTGLSPAWQGERGDREREATSPEGLQGVCRAGSARGSCHRALMLLVLGGTGSLQPQLVPARWASQRSCHRRCCRVLRAQAQLPVPPRPCPQLEKPQCSSARAGSGLQHCWAAAAGGCEGRGAPGNPARGCRSPGK